MKSLRSLFSAFILALALLMPGAGIAAPKTWEPLKNIHVEAKSVAKDSRIEVMTRPALIIVNVNQPVKIEVFTILGRLVSSASLNPGNYELAVGVHGVYIVKIGEKTYKITI